MIDNIIPWWDEEGDDKFERDAWAEELLKELRQYIEDLHAIYGAKIED